MSSVVKKDARAKEQTRGEEKRSDAAFPALDIRPGWVQVPMSEVVSINPRIDRAGIEDDQMLAFVPMPAVEAGTGKVDQTERRPFSKVKKGFTAFQPNDVLFAKITPCMENGKMAVVPDLSPPLAFGSTEFHVLRPDGCLLPSFLYYFVSSSAFRHAAQHNMTGAVGQKRVPRPYLESHPIPVPPLAEQHRIVEKTETLFVRIEKGEEALRQVQALLGRYRQSILKAAVTGELTREWRDVNQHDIEPASQLLRRILEQRRANWQGRGKYKEPLLPKTEELWELPEEWQWVCVDQLGEVIGGLTKNAKRTELPLRRPMVRVANVYQNRLELDEVHETGVRESELRRVLLKHGDLLIVEGNGSREQIGRMAIWREEIPDAVHQNHLIKARFFEEGLAEYLLMWFQSLQGRHVIEQVASSTSGLYTLSLSKVRALMLPLPPFGEAKEIVAQVEMALSEADAVEQAVVAEMQRSGSLRQSILKSAFSGQLVPQNPEDEPASEQLERIRAS